MKRKAVEDLAYEQADKKQKLNEPDSLLETGKALFHGTTPGIEQDYAQAKHYFEKIPGYTSRVTKHIFDDLQNVHTMPFWWHVIPSEARDDVPRYLKGERIRINF